MKLPEGQSPAAFEMLAQHCHSSSPQFMTDAAAKDVQMTVKVIGKVPNSHISNDRSSLIQYECCISNKGPA